MDCKYCHKSFSKGEHLSRHERSHTGVRPFVCKECRRPFARQDSLARHQKLHTRRGHAQYPSPPSSHASRPTIPSPLSSGEPSVNVDGTATQPSIQENSWDQEECSAGSGLSQNAPHSADIDFNLIWPDSEQLFDSLMALDPTPQRQMPLGTLSDSNLSHSISNGTLRSVSSFRDNGFPIGPILSGESHQAVHNVSEMVTTLSSNVTAAVEATSVTSVFLDECLHMFFERFIPTFPILHRSTFVFREYSQPLLLNAMAIGSLYLGPKSSIAKGEALWRLAHIAVTTSWEKLITHQGPHDSCPGVQLVITALLAQVYGALSKNRAIRTTSQAFHALGFHWARQCALLDSESSYSMSLPPVDASEAEKQRCWRIWAAKEVRHRALLGHYLLDGLVSRMAGESPSVRHSANKLGLPSTEAVFDAQTANEWLTYVRLQQIEQCSFRSVISSLFQPDAQNQLMHGHTISALSLRVVLEGLQSLVSDCDNEDVPTMGVPTKSELQSALAQVHESIVRNPHLSNAERLETLLRWHTICLDACKDSSTLCLSICARFGIEQYVCGGRRSPTRDIDLISVVNTEDARRALLHAIAIQDIIEQLPRGRAHVIHIPSSLFAAATIFCVFSLGGLASVNIPSMVDWETVLSSNYDHRTFPGQPDSISQSETKRYIRGEYSTMFGAVGVTKNLLYELNSMQKLFRCLCSQWGIAYDMEDVLDQWNALCH